MDVNNRQPGFSITNTKKIIRNTKIGTKILILVVAICLTSLISVSFISLYTIIDMSEYSRQVDYMLGKESADYAETALIGQAHEYLQTLTLEQAKNCNRLLSSIMYDARLLAGVTEDIFHNPGYYLSSRPVVRPSQAVEGVMTGTYSLPSSIQMTEEIERELALLSNVSLLTPTMSQNPDIVEIYVGMESGLFYNYTAFTFENPEYDPRTRPWYIKALEDPGNVVFTDVYEDAFGTGQVLTVAKAVFDRAGKPIGVAALDMLLENVKNLIFDVRIHDSGYAFIINNEGTFIVHPDMGTDGFVVNAAHFKDIDSALAEGYARMMRGESGFVNYETDGKSFYMMFSPISVSGWSVGIHVDEVEILSSLGLLTEQMDALTLEAANKTSEMTKQAFFTLTIVFLLVILMVICLSVLLTRLISKPIRELTNEVTKVGEGDFKYRIPVKSYDEIGFLTKAFNDMADNLYNYAQDIIGLERRKMELETLSNTDQLTGILNRRGFTEIAAKRIDYAVKDGVSAFLVVFDLDDFKQINDNYGHNAGDAVLRSVTETVVRLIRPGDTFARYGGEEFVLVFTDISEDKAMTLVERIRQNISASPVKFDGGEIPVTASFGIAEVTASGGCSGAFPAADRALYKAKETGKNKVQFG